jgi:type II secretory pathway component PulF
MYPLAIIALSAVTLGVLMTVALPPLLKVFDQMDAEIPLMTKVVVGSVSWISGNYGTIGLTLLLMTIALITIRKFERTSYAMDQVMLRAPTIGPFIIAGELSRFARTLSMLLEAGVTLASAIRLATTGAKNRELKRAFAECEESLLSGHGMIDTLRNYKTVPTMFIELLLLGEETNSLQKTMLDAAIAYQKQLESRLDALLGMLEPISTVVVGLIVGIIAFSMFVPIYSGLNAVGQ